MGTGFLSSQALSSPDSSMMGMQRKVDAARNLPSPSHWWPRMSRTVVGPGEMDGGW